jgi:hypothetical protein
MARILITTEPGDGSEPAVLLEERVLPTHMESGHFSAQLVERVGWAVADAQAHEDGAPAREQRRGATEAGARRGSGASRGV